MAPPSVVAPPVPAAAAPTERPVAPARPATVGLAAAAIALAFVVLRLLAHGGDPGEFVRAGEAFTDGVRAGEVTVVEGSGYDGQFSHRLARAPLSSADRVDGIGFDRPVDRAARVGYPALAWVASAGGQATLVPWALIGVNVAALGLVAGMGAVLARDVERSAWWGLLPALSPGLLVALSRDLTEVVAAAGLLVALVLLRRQRHLAATAVLVGAALTRETTLVLALAVIGAWVLHHLGGRGPALAARTTALFGGDGDRTVPVWVGIVPLAAYGVWRGYLTAIWDAPTAFGADDPTNALGVPGVALVRQMGSFAGAAGDPVALVQLVQLVLVLVLVGLTVKAALTPSAARGHERLAVLGALALLLSLTVWDRAVVFLRYPSDLLVLGAAVVPAAGAVARRVRNVAIPLAAITAVMWVAVA